MDIKEHNYVATPGEIGKLATEMITAETTSLANRSTYLKALVATSQAALPRGDTSKEAALTAFEETHGKFMDAVNKAASDSLPPRTTDRALLLNRRTAFARSSASMLRTWIRSGGHLHSLKPRSVTKASLAVERPPRPPTAARLKTRVETQSKALVASLLQLGEKDHATAAAELDLLMTQLTDQLGAITGGASAVAIKRFQAARTQVLTKAEVQRALQQ